MNLADSVYDSYIISPSKSEILPEENSSTTWRFTNLLRLDDFWVQTMVIVFRHTKSRALYNWIPHPWYYFAQMSKVNQFYTLFEKEGWRYYSTIGGDSFLDRRYADAMPKSFFKCRLGETPVFSDMSRYCTIIGDYMITVKLDPATVTRVEELFCSVSSMKQFEVERAIQLLTRPGKFTFKLEHSPKKIAGLTKKYQRYFGLT